MEPVSTNQPTVDTTPNSTAPLSSGADTTAINSEMQDLYNTISQKIGLAVANGHFTVETFEVILAKVVETIEEFSAARVSKLTGVEKRNLGINLVRMILADLHTRGQISDELFSSFNMALTYVAPALFAAAKIAWTKIQQIDADIAKSGCSGCFKRNC
jgi:hypothetical protein